MNGIAYNHLSLKQTRLITYKTNNAYTFCESQECFFKDKYDNSTSPGTHLNHW